MQCPLGLGSCLKKVPVGRTSCNSSQSTTAQRNSYKHAPLHFKSHKHKGSENDSVIVSEHILFVESWKKKCLHVLYLHQLSLWLTSWWMYHLGLKPPYTFHTWGQENCRDKYPCKWHEHNLYAAIDPELWDLMISVLCFFFFFCRHSGWQSSYQ